MDIQALATNVTGFLAPFLPYLLKAGEKAAEEVGKKLGADAWEKAKSLWGRLRSKPNVAQIANTVASLPDNQPLRAALQEEVARALEQDKSLAQEVAQLMGVTITSVSASGDRSVAIGGNVSGSTIITGNGNKVGR